MKPVRWRFRRFAATPFGYRKALFWGICFCCGRVWSGNAGSHFMCQKCRLDMPWQGILPADVPWARVPTREEAHAWMDAKEEGGIL